LLERWLGLQPHDAVDDAMRAFTAARDPQTPDELWLVEHEPVFTQGVAGRDEHVLQPGAIPVRRSNRGGQVTYHGPGQVVAYPLVDLRRRGIYAKEYVYRLEQAVIDTLSAFGLTGHRLRGAPGIYVVLADPGGHGRLQRDASLPGAFDGLGKVAALGVKISNHCAYHGVALNVAMDLQPFARINPCGYAGMRTVDLRSCGVDVPWTSAARELASHLQRLLSL
jgi:lipoyl(octanoyl) transferase